MDRLQPLATPPRPKYPPRRRGRLRRLVSIAAISTALLGGGCAGSGLRQQMHGVPHRDDASMFEPAFEQATKEVQREDGEEEGLEVELGGETEDGAASGVDEVGPSDDAVRGASDDAVGGGEGEDRWDSEPVTVEQHIARMSDVIRRVDVIIVGAQSEFIEASVICLNDNFAQLQEHVETFDQLIARYEEAYQQQNLEVVEQTSRGMGAHVHRSEMLLSAMEHCRHGEPPSQPTRLSGVPVEPSPPRMQITSQLGLGTTVRLAQQVEVGFGLSLDLGLLVRPRHYRNIYVRSALGYSFDSAPGPTSHTFSAGAGIGGGGEHLTGMYQARFLIGMREDELAIGLQHGLMFGIGLFGLHVDHQILWDEMAPSHALRLILSLDVGQVFYRMGAFGSDAVGIGHGHGENPW